MGEKPDRLCDRLTSARVDVFGDLFRGVRAHGSLFGSSTLSPPWALQFVDGAPADLVHRRSPGRAGSCRSTVRPSRSAPTTRSSYGVPRPFTFVDELGTAAEPIACGEYCAAPEQGGTRHRLGWNDCGGDTIRDATTLIVGAYPVRGEISRRLLDALPVVLRVARRRARTDAVLDHLAAEVAVDAPGQQVVLDRLLDWMLVCTLREWFDRPGGEPPAWYAAQRDPVVGDALRLLHAEPGGAVDGLLAGRRAPGCRVPRWRSGSPTWSANRR